MYSDLSTIFILNNVTIPSDKACTNNKRDDDFTAGDPNLGTSTPIHSKTLNPNYPIIAIQPKTNDSIEKNRDQNIKGDKNPMKAAPGVNVLDKVAQIKIM